MYIVSSSHLNDGNNIRTKMFHIGDVMLLTCVEKQWLCFFLILFLVKLPMQIELSTAFRLVWVFHISFAIRASPLHTHVPFSLTFTRFDALLGSCMWFLSSNRSIQYSYYDLIQKLNICSSLLIGRELSFLSIYNKYAEYNTQLSFFRNDYDHVSDYRSCSCYSSL